MMRTFLKTSTLCQLKFEETGWGIKHIEQKEYKNFKTDKDLEGDINNELTAYTICQLQTAFYKSSQNSWLSEYSLPF